MRNFCFTTRISPRLSATLKVDIINDSFEKFTVMYMEGVRGTIFEKYMPWNVGSVISKTDIKNWYAKYQHYFIGFEYGTSISAVELGIENEYALNITPTILNGSSSTLLMKTVNSEGDTFEEEISLSNSVVSSVNIYKGYTYNFYLKNSEDIWTETPNSITCSGNATLNAKITVPNSLATHTIAITPTITGGTEAVVTMTGVKNGYVSTSKDITLGTEVVNEDAYEGFTYSFAIKTANAAWTGAAPSDVLVDGDKAVSLGITISE